MIPRDAIIGHEYDVIEVEGNIALAVEWCKKTFGDPGHRWFLSRNRFYFANSKDAMWFELRY